MAYFNRAFSILFIFSLMMACTNEQQQENEQPEDVRYYPDLEAYGGWRKNTNASFVKSLGVNINRLTEMAEWNQTILKSSQDKRQLESILVIKDGWIIAERYDLPVDQFQPVPVASISKSVMMVLLGIAFDEYNNNHPQHPLNLDSKFYNEKWFPNAYPLSDKRKQEITFRQVLNHTSGLTPDSDIHFKHVEQGRYTWTNFRDWVFGNNEDEYNAKLFYEPGKPRNNFGFEYVEKWGDHIGAYSTIGYAHLSIFMQNVFDMPVEDYLNDRLFSRLGIHDYEVANDSKNKNEAISYNWFGGTGLSITPRDLARVAYLFIKDGEWGIYDYHQDMNITNSIVDEKWLNIFTEDVQYQNIRSNRDGYFGEQYPDDLIRFFGAGANLVYIVPSLDLIAIRTSRASHQYFNFIERNFLKKLFDSVPYVSSK